MDPASRASGVAGAFAIVALYVASLFGFDPPSYVAGALTTIVIALVPVTISFAAIEGGPMEGVEAVGNLRNATAVFSFARGHWTTAGKAVFNLNPDETLTHFKNQYERVEKH